MSNKRIIFEGTEEQVENLKKLIKHHPDSSEFAQPREDYQTDAIWGIDAVQNDYECDDKKAMEILEKALHNEATVDQIWFAIHFNAGNEALTKKGDEW